VMFTPDARTVVSGGHTLDSAIRFWNPATATSLGEPVPVKLAGIAKLVLSQEGSRIAVAGLKNVILLNSKTHDIVAELSAPSVGFASAVVFVGDRDKVAVASGNRILLYDISRANVVRVACRKAGRSFTPQEWQTLAGADVVRRNSCSETR
jgi:hypothetical protein